VHVDSTTLKFLHRSIRIRMSVINCDHRIFYRHLSTLLGAAPLSLDRQKKSQLKYDSAVIEKLVAIAQFGKPRSFLIVNFGLTQSDIELVYDWPASAQAGQH
jgi:hypothetical protein